MTYRIAPSVTRLLLLQCAVGLVLAGLSLLWRANIALSVLVGAGITVLPNMYFALRVFDMSKGRGAASTLRAFYVGAAGKFAVTVALFCLAFLLLPSLSAPALLVGFAAAQMMNWVSLLFNNDKNATRAISPQKPN